MISDKKNVLCKSNCHGNSISLAIKESLPNTLIRKQSQIALAWIVSRRVSLILFPRSWENALGKHWTVQRDREYLCQI